jgi:Domain of unknown function DUF29
MMTTKDAAKQQAAERARTASERAGVRACYDTDLYGWAVEQAELLRAGRLSDIDAPNIAEQLDDVGNEQYDKLESALTVLLMHLLKWDHQPEKRSRSWENTIREQRRRVERVLRKNFGLKPLRDEAVGEGYADGRDRASTEMDIAVADFPERCPYGWDEIMKRPINYEPPARA